MILSSGCITALVFVLLNKKMIAPKRDRKKLITILSVVSAVVVLGVTLALCLGGTRDNNSSISDIGGVDGPQTRL